MVCVATEPRCSTGGVRTGTGQVLGMMLSPAVLLQNTKPQPEALPVVSKIKVVWGLVWFGFNATQTGRKYYTNLWQRT